MPFPPDLSSRRLSCVISGVTWLKRLPDSVPGSPEV
ncbi:hypothetical protein [Akkermansia phage Moulinsart]|nr:hypothetical protein [Akkermansia phage Moulinsart]